MNSPFCKLLAGDRCRKWIILYSIRRGIIALTMILFMVLIGSFLSGIVPLVIGKSLENILGQAGSVTLSFSGLRVLLFIGVGAILVQFFNQLLQKIFNRSFMNYWIPCVCEKVSRIELQTLESFEAGYVNRRISSEIHTIPSLFSIEVPGLVESVLVMVFSLVMLVHLLPSVTLVLVGAAILLIPFGLFIAKRVKQLLKGIVEIWSRLEGLTTQFVASQLQIRSYSAEQRMCAHVSERVQGATGIDLKNSFRVMLLFAIILLITIGGMIAFLLFAESSPGVATAQTGTVIAFLGYLGLFSGRVSSLTTSMGRIQGSMAYLDRMAEFLQLPENSVEKVTVHGGTIESITIRNLGTKIKDTPICTDLSFSARKGEIVAIRGRSGCGKTTLLKTLFGFCPPSEGSILVNGVPVSGLMTLGESAVFLPQEAKFFNGSLKWNLELLSGTRVDADRLSGVLCKLHLDDRLDAKHSEITDLSEGGTNLSGGEKQRLALAAVLLRKPQILVLDEPTSQLDVETEETILETIKELAEGGTIVVIVSHTPSVERMATVTIQLDEGLCPE
jgi:ATP-binding cassette, subfamily B, bacterial AbcA/BmrA